MNARRSFAIFVLGLSLARAASAEPTPAELQGARELFAEAERDERRGDFEAARSKLEKVAAIKATAAVHLHLGICDEHGSRLVAALEHYEEASRRASVDGKHDVAKAVEKPLRDLSARVPRLVVRVPRVPPGLRVTLDDKPLRESSFGSEQRLEPGPHRLAALAPDFEAFERVFAMKEGDREETTIHLVPKPVAEAGRVEPAAVTRVNLPAAPEAAPDRTKAVVLTGGAVLLLAGGTASFFVAASKADDARGECAGARSCDPGRGSIRTFDTFAIVGWAGGVALSVWAIASWAAPPKAGAPVAAPKSAEVLVGPSFAGVRGAF